MNCLVSDMSDDVSDEKVVSKEECVSSLSNEDNKIRSADEVVCLSVVCSAVCLAVKVVCSADICLAVK